MYYKVHKVIIHTVSIYPLYITEALSFSAPYSKLSFLNFACPSKLSWPLKLSLISEALAKDIAKEVVKVWKP